MKETNENRFIQELREMEDRLRRAGRPTAKQGMLEGESGLNSNLDLPYSTLPKLRGQRWIRTEKDNL